MAIPSINPLADRQWLKITFSCPLILLESAADLMAVLSGVGVEQSPETATGAFISGFFSLPAPDDKGDVETADHILARVQREMADLFALYNCQLDAPVTLLLADQDWATSWQQYFKPFEIVPGLVIKPSWEEYPSKTGQHILELDPGMAFGTGQHASTQLALALIKKSIEQTSPARVLDVGTGTGILAMAAALFGAERVVALDNDEDAVVVARENVTKNGLTRKIDVSATPIEQIQGTYQLICANIVHDVLVEMAPLLTELTTAGGNLVLAGILSGEQEEHIISIYGGLGVQLRDRQYQEEWVALLLQRQ